MYECTDSRELTRDALQRGNRQTRCGEGGQLLGNPERNRVLPPTKLLLRWDAHPKVRSAASLDHPLQLKQSDRFEQLAELRVPPVARIKIRGLLPHGRTDFTQVSPAIVISSRNDPSSQEIHEPRILS